jgi:hypothetical protein
VQTTGGLIHSEKVIVGTLALPVAGMRLPPGARMSADMAAPAGTAPGSLLVTLATHPRNYGKRQTVHVRVGGVKRLILTDTDPGGGVTRSFFVDFSVPPAKTTAVEVASDAASEAPVTVASLRLYPSVGAYRPESPRGRMGLALLTPEGGGYTATAAGLRDLFQKIPKSPNIEGQLAVLYNFAAKDAGENRKAVHDLVALAEAVNVPLRIAFQVHWGGVPRGVSDGAGGTFTDAPYQQVTFDPADKTDDPGLRPLLGDRWDLRFGLSVPNRWSDTPWLTFNHPRLNQLRRVRLTQAVTAWRAERERLAAGGKERLLPGELSTGEETVYWAKGVDDAKYAAANGAARADLMADFNPFVAADALRSGVDLDPRDGLSLTERVWLHGNLAQQQQRIVDWMFDALPPEPVVLAGSGPRFAGDLARRNIYTEPYGMPLFPMKEVDPRRPGLEAGYVYNGRSGGQYWSGATMLPWLLKERERGRIALPNLEATGADDPQLIACLRAAYACGARFATVYNGQHRENLPQILRAFAESTETPAALEWLPAADGQAPAASRWTREFTAPADAFGVNAVDIFPAGGGGAAAVTIKDADSPQDHAVTVLTGLWGGTAPVRVPLPTLFHLQPGRKIIVTIASPDGGPLALRAAADGQAAVRLVSDIALERGRSGVIQDWRDAADILEAVQGAHARGPQSRFARESLAEAEKLLAAGRPEDAYRAAVRSEQLSLPAAYDLPRGGGRLEPYWIAVECPGGPVWVRILTYSADAASVSIRGAVEQKVKVRWGMTEMSAQLAPGVPVEMTLVRRVAPVRSTIPVRRRRR